MHDHDTPQLIFSPLCQSVSRDNVTVEVHIFRLAGEQGQPPEFDHPLSLQAWWESGGQAWLASLGGNSYLTATPSTRKT